MPLWLKLLLLLVLIAVLGWLAANPPTELRPVQDGTAEEYWQLLHRLEPPKDNIVSGSSASLPLPADGHCYYSEGGFHGSSYYRVSETEVAALWPEVVRRLEAADPKSWQAEGYRHWLELDPNRKRWSDLAMSLRATFLKEKANKRLFSFSLQTDSAMQWGFLLDRISLYPLLQFGEWVYLSGVVVFAAWPWLRNLGRWRWGIHFALLPWLLMLPYYLGYCSWTFSPEMPSGGVVYPRILKLVRPVPWCDADTNIVRQLPKTLASLNGPIVSLDGWRSCGPLAMGVIGLGLGAAVFGAGTLGGRAKRGRNETPSPAPPRRVT